MDYSRLLFVLLISVFLALPSADGRDYPTRPGYWQLRLPDLAFPTRLAHRVSRIDASATARYLKMIKDGSLASHSSDFCDEAALACDGSAELVVQVNVNYRLAQVLSFAKSSGTTPNTPLYYFREKDILQGNKMAVRLVHDSGLPKRAFLPSAIADSISFTSNNLPEIVNMLGLPKNSNMQLMMQNTLSACEISPIPGEKKLCAKSLEAVVDFAVSQLGSNLNVLQPQASSGEDGHVVEVVSFTQSMPERSVVCHSAMFPFQVYYCHTVVHTKIYNMKVQQEDGKVVEGGVITCHMKTDEWEEDMVALAQLHVKPGESEACHWVSDDGIVFLPKEM